MLHAANIPPRVHTITHMYVRDKEYLNGSACQYRRGHARVYEWLTKILSGAAEGLAMPYLNRSRAISHMIYSEWTCH